MSSRFNYENFQFYYSFVFSALCSFSLYSPWQPCFSILWLHDQRSGRFRLARLEESMVVFILRTLSRGEAFLTILNPSFRFQEILTVWNIFPENKCVRVIGLFPVSGKSYLFLGKDIHMVVFGVFFGLNLSFILLLGLCLITICCLKFVAYS
jgi:hypothetical protein